MTNDLTPWIPAFTAAAGGAVIGAFNLLRGKKGDNASKTPTVAQVWDRLDSIEKELRSERAGRYTLLRVFRSYVDRVQKGGSLDLTDEERQELDDSTPSPPEHVAA